MGRNDFEDFDEHDETGEAYAEFILPLRYVLTWTAALVLAMTLTDSVVRWIWGFLRFIVPWGYPQ